MDTAQEVASACVQIESTCYDLIILDVMLPDGNGISLCHQWRLEGKTMPVLILTALDDESSIIQGLDLGGDDYMVKPFRSRELLSRIRALLRRQSPSQYIQGPLMVDLDRMSIKLHGNPIYLTPTEFQLLTLFVRNPGRIMTRAQLLMRIWDDAGNYIDDNTLSVHISRLREKIGQEYIQTQRGFGYTWNQEVL